MIWYNNAFDADNRSSIIGESTIEELERYHAGVAERISQPTSYAEAILQQRSDDVYSLIRDEKEESERLHDQIIDNEIEEMMIARQGDLEEQARDSFLDK